MSFGLLSNCDRTNYIYFKNIGDDAGGSVSRVSSPILVLCLFRLLPFVICPLSLVRVSSLAICLLPFVICPLSLVRVSLNLNRCLIPSGVGTDLEEEEEEGEEKKKTAASASETGMKWNLFS